MAVSKILVLTALMVVSTVAGRVVSFDDPDFRDSGFSGPISGPITAIFNSPGGFGSFFGGPNIGGTGSPGIGGVGSPGLGGIGGPGIGGLGGPSFGGLGSPSFGGLGSPSFGGLGSPSFGGLGETIKPPKPWGFGGLGGSNSGFGIPGFDSPGFGG